MALKHRSCRDVHSIPDVIETTTFQQTDVDTTVQMLINMKDRMAQTKEDRETFLQQLLGSKTKAIEAIKKYRQEMEGLIEHLEKESIIEVEKKFRKIEYILNQEKDKAEKEEDELKRDTDNLQKSDGNRAQQFVYMKSAQTKYDETEMILRSLEERSGTELFFVENTDIRKFMQSTKALGTVKDSRPVPSQPKTTLYAVNNVRVINVKTSKDTSYCDVYSSCFTENGILFLADYKNKKLKRVDIVQKSVTDQCDLPYGPRGVCFISKREAAVCLINQSIQFVSLGNRMSCARQIKLDHEAFGVAYKDKKLYITDYIKSSVYIHDMTGNLLQTVTSDSSGKNIFQSCWHFAFSENDTMFVSTYYGLVNVTKEGQHVKTFHDPNLMNVSGVCTDNRGNIFASAYGSSKVIQIKQEGLKEVGVIAQGSDGIKQPRSVCFDQSQNILVVTQSCTDSILLFGLQ